MPNLLGPPAEEWQGERLLKLSDYPLTGHRGLELETRQIGLIRYNTNIWDRTSIFGSMKIGLFELTTYHEECLYTQVKFLRDGGHHIELFLNPKLKKQVAPYAALADRCSYFDFTPGTFLPRRIGRFLKFYRYLKKGRFDVLIFNTASSKKELLLLCLLFRNGTPALTGTLHNLQKLRNSLTQKVFSSSIKQYLVLND